jgi:hypothetical protein
VTPRQKAAIAAFASSVKELKESGVIRSDRYLGDLAEFLCADAFQLDLATNLRQVGHDGMREGVKVQIKYGGGKKKNVDLGDPATYEEVYVVLGRGSVVRSSAHQGDFLIYKLPRKEVLGLCTSAGTYSCGAGALRREPDRVISIDDVHDSIDIR